MITVISQKSESKSKLYIVGISINQIPSSLIDDFTSFKFDKLDVQ